MKAQSVLLIEADPETASLLVDLLEREGYVVTALESIFGALAAARRLRPDVILLNLELPYRSGASFLGRLRADPDIGEIPILLFAAFPELLTAERRALATRVLRKPMDVPSYRELVLTTLAQAR